MEENQAVNPGAALSADQVEQVAGGDGCTTTVTISTSDIGITTTAPSVGDALIGTYDGVVAATSHVIETVAKSF